MIRDANPNVGVTTKNIEGDRKDSNVEQAQTWGSDHIGLGTHGY
jgi:hypothetical protein